MKSNLALPAGDRALARQCCIYNIFNISTQIYESGRDRETGSSFATLAKPHTLLARRNRSVGHGGRRLDCIADVRSVRLSRSSQIAEGFKTIILNNWQQIAITLARYLVAFLCAIIAGWATGLLMGAFRQTFGRFMRAMIAIIQAVPALAWILLAVLWMRSVEARIWFITFITAFPFFVVAVYEGIRDMDRDVLEAIEQFRPTRMQILRILLIPQSITYLIISMRATAAMTLKIMVLAEVLAANNGIGRAMATAQSNFKIDLLFA